MNFSRLSVGLFMIIIAYFGMFNPEVFEFLDKLISFQSIQGLFFIFLMIGVLGFCMVYEEVMR